MRRDGQGVMSGAVKAHLDQSTGGPMEVCGKEIRTRGKLIRVAFLDGEGYQFLEDLEATLTAIRGSKFGVDLFTFVQKLSDTVPRYGYSMEWDNLAALRISTFSDWISHQINFKEVC